ncbi:glycine/D-amino acid oxidase-like deaminating enzyme [Stella humosa]|uniref:Glycine/D-amino acid oxidase-like deaminating enzyme n=1 Tax=Stella humosa TaxID=94 RepID=A0A3N1LIV9_9PROT|nr:FAD-dependent oxidoreductase [Stella humosa]ROP91230.1 glycine/D-amino acid oxidase-like deaminating enzyme [Stella humosa]BBK34416.1 FAD-dependent oxidoreductase [Stella humosa]
MTTQDTATDAVEIAIVGAGIVGIAVAHYLAAAGRGPIALIDAGQPMALTSAQSGENYRNWWPHGVMTAFTDHSTTLMEAIARQTGNRIAMTRRGYVLATRQQHPDDLIEQLHVGYGTDAAASVRLHDRADSPTYRPPVSADWETAPDGVDVLLDQDLIRRTFPSFAHDVAAILHIRRAGSIGSQQMGQFMLEGLRAAGGRLLRGRVTGIATGPGFTLALDTADGPRRLRADILVNAAGPHAGAVAAMLGESLPIANVLQQKITFEDREGAIPRQMPFSIDLDGQEIDWSCEERAALAADPQHAWLAGAMPGSIHCRPEGGDGGRWIKLGWAYNDVPGPVVEAPAFDPHFPEVVLRGAARLNPALKAYYGRLPRPCVLYGGYYTMTPENWPLVGPMRTAGAFMATALSGFGTMAACAAGDLCAKWITGAALPAHAHPLSLARYDDAALMAELTSLTSKGVL